MTGRREATANGFIHVVQPDGRAKLVTAVAILLRKDTVGKKAGAAEGAL